MVCDWPYQYSGKFIYKQIMELVIDVNINIINKSQKWIL